MTSLLKYYSIKGGQLNQVVESPGRLNEWHPRGLQISLHIRSPGLQDYSEV